MPSAKIAIPFACLAMSLIAAAPAPADYRARIERILKTTPLIDGHNDWPETLRSREGEKRWTIDLRHLDGSPHYDTDIARLRSGHVGGQFWSVWVSPDLPGQEQVEQTLEQIDLVRDIVARYPSDFAMARTADDVRRIRKSGRMAALIGVAGGGQIRHRRSNLRTYAALGAGYLTLTHTRTVEWADSAAGSPRRRG